MWHKEIRVMSWKCRAKLRSYSKGSHTQRLFRNINIKALQRRIGRGTGTTRELKNQNLLNV